MTDFETQARAVLTAARATDWSPTQQCVINAMWAKISESLPARRVIQIAEMKAKEMEAEAHARAAGASFATALTLGDLEQSEEDANYDVLYGEGWSAEQRAKRVERARLQAEADAEHARWAAANPEEARKAADKQREESRRYWARRRGGGGSEPARASDKNPSAWAMGRRDGARIGIDVQVGGASAAPKRLGHG